MSSLLNLPAGVEELNLVHGISDDFYHYVSGDDFSTVASDLGTVVDTDLAGGRVELAPSDGTVADNDETYVKGTQEVFKFAANKPLDFEASVQFTEGATDDVNIIVGLKDAVAADSLLDNGGGPSASYTGAVFFKVDGGTVWQVETSVAGTQTTTELTAANSLDKRAKTAGGSAFQKLRIEFRPFSSTQADVIFLIDDVQVAKHTYTYTSATEMQICFGIKNGAATTVELLVVDYVRCHQKR